MYDSNGIRLVLHCRIQAGRAPLTIKTNQIAPDLCFSRPRPEEYQSWSAISERIGDRSSCNRNNNYAQQDELGLEQTQR